MGIVWRDKILNESKRKAINQINESYATSFHTQRSVINQKSRMAKQIDIGNSQSGVGFTEASPAKKAD